MRRSRQASLEQREAELARTHTQLVDHMRQSGALLGSLANLHQNLVPQALTQALAQATPLVPGAPIQPLGQPPSMYSVPHGGPPAWGLAATPR